MGRRGGNFHDRVQSRIAKDLNDLVRGRAGITLVFFCQGVRCWEFHNAILRARAAGFQNILWYRGGLSAWSEAGYHAAQRVIVVGAVDDVEPAPIPPVAAAAAGCCGVRHLVRLAASP